MFSCRPLFPPHVITIFHVTSMDTWLCMHIISYSDSGDFVTDKNAHDKPTDQQTKLVFTDNEKAITSFILSY